MTVRRQLRALGVSDRLVGLATPFMFFSPMTVDRRSAGVREIVSGLQRRLREVGFDVRATGSIDVATTRALDWLVPPAGSFAARSFADLATLVLTATASASRARSALGAARTWEHGRDKANCVGLGQTKTTFIHLQNGLNRLATKLRTPRVSVDGIIGKTTVRAAKAVASTVYAPLPERWQQVSCEMIADRAADIAARLHKKADALGIPKKVKGPSPRPRSGGLESMPTAAVSSGGTEALLKFAPYVLIAGGVAFFAIKMRGERT